MLGTYCQCVKQNPYTNSAGDSSKPRCFRYVLKSQMKALLEEEAKNAKSIEEEIEEERRKVDAKTPITQTVRHSMSVFAHCLFCPASGKIEDSSIALACLWH